VTHDEAIKKLQQLDHNDQELAHQEADAILLRLLEHHGFADVADVYRKVRLDIGFWYA